MDVRDLYNILAPSQELKIINLYTKNIIYFGNPNKIPIEFCDKEVHEIYTDEASKCLYVGVTLF